MTEIRCSDHRTSCDHRDADDPAAVNFLQMVRVDQL